MAKPIDKRSIRERLTLAVILDGKLKSDITVATAVELIDELTDLTIESIARLNEKHDD